MSKLLLDEHPLVILPSLAVKVGLNEAVVLQQVHYWLQNHQTAGRIDTFRSGRWWVFNSYEEWGKQFPFWSEPTIKRTFLALEKAGLLVSDYLSDDARDRRKWYSINYPLLEALENNAVASMTATGVSGASDQIDPVQQINLPPPTGSSLSAPPAHPDPMLKGTETPAEIATETAAEKRSALPTAAAAIASDTSAAAVLPASPSGPDRRPPPTGGTANAPMVLELIEAGMNRADALRLAATYPDECRRQLDFLPYVTEFRSGPGAYLRTAIEQGWAPPQAWHEAEEKRRKEAKAAARREQRATQADEANAADEARTVALCAEKERLQREEPERWAALVAEAEASLPPPIKARPDGPAYRPALEAKIDSILTRDLISENYNLFSNTRTNISALGLSL